MARGILSVRANRRGENAVRRATSAVAAPQAETDTYLGRFSSPPSATFAGALDQAIYRWKAAGVWTLLQDFWLLCADTQTDSLRSLVAPARDATITGAPTFTPLKGFGGFGVGDYVSLPFSTSGLSVNSGQIWAGQFDASASPTVLMGQSGRHPGSVKLNNFGTSWVTPTFGVPTASPVVTNPGSGPYSAVIGAQGTTGIDATRTVSNGTLDTVSTSPITTNNAAQTKIWAYGWMPTATSDQVRKFLSILQTFLEDIGAFD